MKLHELKPAAGATKREKRIGRGEASAIALCITQNGILASNNLQDIMIYGNSIESKIDSNTLITNEFN